MTAFISKPKMTELWFGCFEYYPCIQKSGNTFNECLSLSYIPSYVHVRPGYREKSPDLQGTLKAHDFRTKYQGRTGPAKKIDMHIFPACTQDVYKRIHASRVTYGETCACAFTLQVL